MNDRDLRTKKNSIATVRNHQDRTINNSYIRHPANCEPKQPPNISRHYLQTIKKKQAHSKQIKHDINAFHVNVNFYPNTNTNSHTHTHTEIFKEKIVFTMKADRTSYGKYQQEGKVRKTKRSNVHHISKAQKLKNKQHSKENKQCRSNLDYQEIRREKIVRTEVKIQEPPKPYIYTTNLSCKQRLIGKLKGTLKPQSCDLYAQINLQNQSQSHQLHTQSKISSQNFSTLKSFAQQIAQFESKNSKIQIQAQSQTLSQLFYKQQIYSKLQKDYNCYLIKKQSDIDWKKRAKVMNWMLEILSELGSKREIFALAANYIDRYLAAVPNVPTKKLQLLACGAMSLANKVQGMTFAVGHLVIPNQITLDQILQLEQGIALVLKWRLNPPTANMWSNRIAQHWDIYLDHHINNLPELLLQNIDKIKFKSQDGEGYRNYRTLMQYIDISVLDISTLQYHNRQLSASFIYIILNIILNIYSQAQVLQKFPSSSQYLIKDNDLNDFYCDFLQHSFGFSLQDLLPTVQYCATFLGLVLCNELPQCINQDDQVLFSELCSLQTYNGNNLVWLEMRDRQYD